MHCSISSQALVLKLYKQICCYPQNKYTKFPEKESSDFNKLTSKLGAASKFRTLRNQVKARRQLELVWNKKQERGKLPSEGVHNERENVI